MMDILREFLGAKIKQGLVTIWEAEGLMIAIAQAQEQEQATKGAKSDRQSE